MWRRLSIVLAVSAALLAAVNPGSALGDGDPASDVLLGENVFYPYSPPVSASLQKTLNAETTATAKSKFPLKVALIASPVDLGVIPDLFGKPQQYANFLDQEISFQTRQPLLVVMSTGFGVQGVPSRAEAIAATLPKPSGSTSDDLARAAVVAVAKLASAAGHPVSGVAGVPGGSSSGSSSGSSRTLVLIALIVGAVAVAAALLALRRRGAAA